MKKYKYYISDSLFAFRERRLAYQESSEEDSSAEESSEAIQQAQREMQEFIFNHLDSNRTEIRSMAYHVLGKSRSHELGVQKERKIPLIGVSIPFIKPVQPVKNTDAIEDVAEAIAKGQQGIASFFHEEDPRKRKNQIIALQSGGVDQNKLLKDLVCDPTSPQAEGLATFLKEYGGRLGADSVGLFPDKLLPAEKIRIDEQLEDIRLLRKIKVAIEEIDTEDDYKQLKVKIDDASDVVDYKNTSITALGTITKKNRAEFVEFNREKSEAAKEKKGHERTKGTLDKKLKKINKFSQGIKSTSSVLASFDADIDDLADDFSRDELLEKAHFDSTDVKLNESSEKIEDWIGGEFGKLDGIKQTLEQKKSHAARGKMTAKKAFRVAQERLFGDDLKLQGFSDAQKEQYYQHMADMLTKESEPEEGQKYSAFVEKQESLGRAGGDIILGMAKVAAKPFVWLYKNW